MPVTPAPPFHARLQPATHREPLERPVELLAKSQLNPKSCGRVATCTAPAQYRLFSAPSFQDLCFAHAQETTLAWLRTKFQFEVTRLD